MRYFLTLLGAIVTGGVVLINEPDSVNLTLNHDIFRDIPAERLHIASLQVAPKAYVPDVGDRLITWNSNCIRFVFKDGEISAYIQWNIEIQPIQFDFPERLVSENTLFLAAYNGFYPTDIKIANRLKSIQKPKEIWTIQAHLWFTMDKLSKWFGVSPPPRAFRVMFVGMLWAIALELWNIFRRKQV